MSPVQDSGERREEGGGKNERLYASYLRLGADVRARARLAPHTRRCRSSLPSSSPSRFHISAGTIKSSYAAQRCSTSGASDGRQPRPHGKTSLLATANPPARDVHSLTASRVLY